MRPYAHWLNLLLLSAAACYRSPVAGHCEVQCAAGDRCPADLTCVAGTCAMPGTSCEPEVDAASADGPVDTVTCDWITSNVDACEVDALAATYSWSIRESSTVTVDTDELTASDGTVVMGHVTDAGLDVAVIRAESLDIPFGAALRVSGTRPLVIFASTTVSVGGLIAANAVSDVGPPCGGDAGGTEMRGGGGGGGGHVTPGARGGVSLGDAAPGGGGGAAMTVRALQRGCRGGDGGRTSTGAAGGLGGFGGGALQISARQSLSVAGRIAASGQPGRPAASADGGGGGGGSGGYILVEAPALELAERALCAVGGPGASSTMPGVGGACSGGTPGSPTGGRGGDNAPPASGLTGTSAAAGGGGGGGAAGVIYVRGPSVPAGVAVPSPMP